ncbi:MAG: malto-oligosyltrehalose trehalohydrolase [Rubrivivax sp.]|nr:MAG: malto-oligosyltrehalose trehalohydrolase [Rubrivivax sp.]
MARRADLSAGGPLDGGLHAGGRMSSEGRHVHPMPFGARQLKDGRSCFRLWAPGLQAAELVLKGSTGERRLVGAERGPDGWHQATVDDAPTGTRYRWRLPDGLEVPDPASRSNPDGVHDFSELIDPGAYAWQGLDDRGQPWRGRPWHEAVFYELHVGTYTPEGTFAAAEQRLPALAALGITAIQLMPLASWPGRFGWGYDGVLHFAPHAAYGSPDELKHFIDTAHRLGLMVMLDVVYNHFGPDGNYLSAYAPSFFSDRHHTAWGAAINFDGADSDTVREFFVHNALYWLEEYRFDGLRFDAVHAMVDDSRPDIMQTLSQRIRAAHPDRFIHLVQENDSNDPARLGPPATPGLFDGQWSGDFHHALHVLLTGERDGYYAEYVDDTPGQLATSLSHGLVWQGGPHNVENAPPRRRADQAVPLSAMVNFLQNHDQVGNRAMGDRLSALLPAAPLRLCAAMLLLQPGTPLLFMGEEFGATTPFLYFSDWQGELRQAVTEGRRREFAQFPRFADPALREQIPDPCDEATFVQSKLDWTAADSPEGQAWRALHTELLATRARWIQPHLAALRLGGHTAEWLAPTVLSLRWRVDVGMALRMVVNLSGQAVGWSDGGQQVMPERAFFTMGEVEAAQLGAWAGAWWWADRDDSSDRTQ